VEILISAMHFSVKSNVLNPSRVGWDFRALLSWLLQMFKHC